jgi:hypothetical protein
MLNYMLFTQLHTFASFIFALRVILAADAVCSRASAAYGSVIAVVCRP